jgi:hypothetical protein
MGAHRHGVGEIFEQAGQVKIQGFHVQLAGLDFGKIEDVIDQVQAVIRRWSGRSRHNGADHH